MDEQADSGSAWVRPHDDDVVPMIDALAWHADYVRVAGFPVAALILDGVLDDIRHDGPVGTLLPPQTRFGDLPALRVMAAVHALAIERRAPRVALHLPTLGGTPPRRDEDRAAFRDAVVQALVDSPGTLAASLRQTPQTNETGRAALLRCALSRIPGALPVRLREIGTSAGLNLRPDHLPGLQGLEAGPLPVILDRVGCDVSPIDPTTLEGRTALSSYVWVDDVERFERLRRAIAVAERIPATVVTQDAADFVEAMELEEGSTTVLWHSAFWLYLPSPTRARIEEAVARLGDEATTTRRFAYAWWEWAPGTNARHAPFALSLRTWTGAADDGTNRVLAVGNSHGNDVVLADVSGR